MLKFSKANAKIHALANVPSLAQYLQGKRKVYSLDLLSGWSCPYANDCLSKVVTLESGARKIQDGKNTQFRCFSASQEALYPTVYNLRKHNFDAIRQSANMSGLIQDSLPKNVGICRIHVGGDFFNQEYFDAWLAVAKNNPQILFYAYTKSLKFWLNRIEIVNSLPNFVITASYGGRSDELIAKHNLRHAKVVLSELEANGLPIDHDDSHAADPSMKNQNFALLIHGVQPKGSQAAEALKALKGKGSYSRKN